MNSTQRNFKKQMKESLRDLKKKDKEKYYNYIRQNHLEDPEKRISEDTKDKIKNGARGIVKLFYGTVVTIIALSIGISALNNFKKENGNSVVVNNRSNAQSVINSFNPVELNKEQESIVKYLNTLSNIEGNIDKDINLRNNDVNSLNKKLLIRQEFINNLTVYKNRIDVNILNIKQIPYPKDFVNYYGLVINSLNALSNGMEAEIKFMVTNDPAIRKRADEFYKVHRSNIDSRLAELNSVLDRNNIKH